MARHLQIFRDEAIHASVTPQAAKFGEVQIRPFHPAVWAMAALLAATSLAIISQGITFSVKGIVVLPGPTSHTDESSFLILLPAEDKSLIHPRDQVVIVDTQSGWKATGQIIALMSNEQKADFISAYCECDLNAARVSFPVTVAIARWSNQKLHDPISSRPSKELLSATIEVTTTPRKLMLLTKKT